MDPRRNPYSPGAGVRPAELAGRDRELAMFEVMCSRAESGRPAQSIIFYGLRGVGKTVLLNEMLADARDAGWIAAKVEADTGSERTPFRTQVASALNTSLRHAQRGPSVGERVKRALSTFKSFSLTASPDGALSVGIEVEPQLGKADTGSILADLTDLAIDLGEAALDLGTGVVLFIDEMQHLANEELGAVCQACHEAGQRNLPFHVVGAGLPNLPGALALAKSYAERLYQYAPVDRLRDADARAALERPAEIEGVEWSSLAAQSVLDAAAGYPYFIQQFGQSTWDAAVDSPISLTDAEEGIRLGREKLDIGFFLARWERATPAEREYLTAMAEDGDGPSGSGAVAARLRRKPMSLGPTRASLIHKGLVYSPEHGQIAFTVPGMAAFIRRYGQP
jgi:hypothetical protein